MGLYERLINTFLNPQNLSSQFGEIVSDVESLGREFNEENNLLKEDQEKIEEMKLRLFQMQNEVINQIKLFKNNITPF